MGILKNSMRQCLDALKHPLHKTPKYMRKFSLPTLRVLMEMVKLIGHLDLSSPHRRQERIVDYLISLPIRLSLLLIVGAIGLPIITIELIAGSLSGLVIGCYKMVQEIMNTPPTTFVYPTEISAYKEIESLFQSLEKNMAQLGYYNFRYGDISELNHSSTLSEEQKITLERAHRTIDSLKELMEKHDFQSTLNKAEIELEHNLNKNINRAYSISGKRLVSNWHAIQKFLAKPVQDTLLPIHSNNCDRKSYQALLNSLKVECAYTHTVEEGLLLRKDHQAHMQFNLFNQAKESLVNFTSDLDIVTQEKLTSPSLNK